MPTPGIWIRHQAGCRSTEGRRCNCAPTYTASVGAGKRGEKIRRSFRSEAHARRWQAQARVALDEGLLLTGGQTTLRDAADALIAGMQDGTVRTRSGDPYKPSAIRSYEQALRDYLIPDLGGARLSDIRRRDVQRIVDALVGAGASPSTVRNAVMPLRVIVRRSLRDGELAANPTSDIDLPAVRGRRDRIASPEEAALLVAALPLPDRAVWATALYAGLRRGELRALEWSDIDLATGVIHVRRSLDQTGVVVAPKSRAGKRRVPVPQVLREILIEHKLATGGVGLAFGRTATTAFDPSTVASRARRAWQARQLEPIGLHEARHTFASLMIAAGVNPKALSTYMGHGSITITLDRYGHLLPGNEDQAADLLDAFLRRRCAAAATD